VLQLGEELLDRVEVGAVGRQEEHVRPGLANGAAGGLAFVAAKIVEDDDVALGATLNRLPNVAKLLE